MSLRLNFFILLLWFPIRDGLSPPTKNPLNGQHLRVIWPRWEGNPKGLSGPLKGGVVLSYLSARFNFTFEMVRVTENWLEPPANRRGLFSYLLDNQCDFLIQDVVPTSQRLKIVDLTLPWNYGYFVFLIPGAGYAANINAVVKPFQWPVWLLLGISTFLVIFTLNQLKRFLDQQNFVEKNSAIQETNSTLPGLRVRINSPIIRTDKLYLYVFGNLLSQGGSCPSKWLSFRVVAGTWVVSAFIFVQAYTSTLFTYVISPIRSPLINNIYDVVQNTDINMYVKKSGSLDNLFTNTTDNQLYRQMRKRLDSVPNSRCTFVADCISMVTPGSKNVYFDTIPYQLDAIKENFEKTGKCNLQLSEDRFLNIIVTMALPLHSHYTKTMSKGLLELQEIGLVNFWDLWFRPMPNQCKGSINVGLKSTSKGIHQRLSLQNLTGAFVVLLVGLTASLVVFLYEQITVLARRRLLRAPRQRRNY